MELWEEINNLLTNNPKPLTIEDIETDLNWLYEKKQLDKPKIIIFTSMKNLRDYCKTEGIDLKDKHHYGLHNELSFYAYWMDQKSVWTEDLKRYCNFLRKGIYYFIPENDKALICMLPKKIQLDDQKKFHSLTKPAILWHDNKGKYYIHGVRFSKVLHEKISKRTITPKEILAIKNIEQRYIALKHYGFDKLIDKLPSKLIDKSKRGNELYEIEIDDQLTAKVIKYKCPSTDRVYLSAVPFEMTKADESMAWKFGISEQEYQGLKVEA